MAKARVACGRCGRARKDDQLRRDGAGKAVCLDCLSAAEEPITRRAVALAAEAASWPDGRAVVALRRVALDPRRPRELTLSLVLDRSQGDELVDALPLATAAELVDPVTTQRRVAAALAQEDD
jgi:hypothetical protein